jgi:TonB family protein
MKAIRGFTTRYARASLLLIVCSLLAVLNVCGQEGRKLVEQSTPIYPQLARRSGLSGIVKVQIVIAPDGHVRDVKVIGGHPLFIDATVEALKRWKYAPSNSETVAALEFNFHP